jgi:RNA-directed DNA polymerase
MLRSFRRISAQCHKSPVAISCIARNERRIRLCDWKQWHGVRNRIRHLLALGTRARTAIWTGMSSKSDLHLSRSLGTQTAMTNDWLKGQGLIRIRDQWMTAHGYG